MGDLLGLADGLQNERPLYVDTVVFAGNDNFEYVITKDDEMFQDFLGELLLKCWKELKCIIHLKINGKTDK